jgi:hypothetical protein
LQPVAARPFFDALLQRAIRAEGSSSTASPQGAPERNDDKKGHGQDEDDDHPILDPLHPSRESGYVVSLGAQCHFFQKLKQSIELFALKQGRCPLLSDLR